MLFFDETYKQNKGVFDKVIRLSPEEIADPHSVLKEFFNKLTLSEVRELLYNVQRVSLTTDNLEFQEPEDRCNLIYVLERIEQLIEAAYLLKSQKTVTLNNGKGKQKKGKRSL